MGRFVIIMDDETRENEGDLVLAAQYMTPEKMAFMVRYTRYDTVSFKEILGRFGRDFDVFKWTCLCTINSGAFGFIRYSYDGCMQHRQNENGIYSNS